MTSKKLVIFSYITLYISIAVLIFKKIFSKKLKISRFFPKFSGNFRLHRVRHGRKPNPTNFHQNPTILATWH